MRNPKPIAMEVVIICNMDVAAESVQKGLLQVEASVCGLNTEKKSVGTRIAIANHTRRSRNA
jgi:hypothetical protein